MCPSRLSTGRPSSARRTRRSTGSRASTAAPWSGRASRSCMSGPSSRTPTRCGRCSTGRVVSARYILVAVGAHPTREPPIPGGDLAITSNEVFHLKTQPRRLLVIGGGYIAVEFAGIFAGLGSNVTLLHRGEKLLRGFDEDVSDALGAAYEKRGIRLALGRTVERIDRRRRRDRGEPVRRLGHRGRRGPRRHGTPPQHGRPRARKGRRRGRRGRRRRRRRLFEEPDAVDLCGRRRDEPGQPHAGRDPRRARLRRHGLRQHAVHGRSHAHPDCGLLDAGNRRHRLRRGRGARHFRRDRRLQDELPPVARDALGPRREGD